jgi:hypothetical protein
MKSIVTALVVFGLAAVLTVAAAPAGMAAGPCNPSLQRCL